MIFYCFLIEKWWFSIGFAGIQDAFERLGREVR